METLYWVLEYGKVFCGYLILMFLWPSVVFGGYLRKKAKSYRFSFCVTVQIVIVNTLVLLLGLFHVLNQITLCIFFYGVFAYVLLKRAIHFYHSKNNSDNTENHSKKTFFYFHTYSTGGLRPANHIFRDIRLRGRERLWECRHKIQPWFREYGLLAIVLIYGMIYFSYGAFQVHSYGGGDLYAHHEWIYGLINGNVFSGGVYPEAMHCFIYSMSMLFGIRVYSILLFLQGIHVLVFFLSAYLLLREVFHWKYSPVIVLMLFLTLDVVSAEQIYSMFRLQITLPLEFGLHTQFLCVLYLVRYLKNESHFKQKARASKYCWDENLFLFMMSLTASIVIHFYTVIMAFILCASFAVFALRKIFNRKYFIPLTVCIACGCLAAITPMAGALVSGIPFNYSIDWAMEAMDGEETRRLQDQGQEVLDTGGGTPEIEAKGFGIPDWAELKEKGIHFFQNTLPGFYRNGLPALYGESRTRWIIGLTGITIILCLIARLRPYHRLHWICRGYPPLILFIFLFLLTYAAPRMGYPDLIPDSRFCSVGHLMILAVIVMPVDAVFSLLLQFFSESLLRIASILAIVGIYAAALLMGKYRGFLFYELTRYNSTVKVTNSIIDTFPSRSFTIVAPTDELYPVIRYGWHEELQSFVESCAGTDYTIPSEYVFIYVEKKPILYAQAYFFEGPFWLGQEKYEQVYWEKYSQKKPDSGASQAPEIKASEITKESAQKELEESESEWFAYTRLENRTILESKAYEWCQRFSERYPAALDVYYEDDDFVCYYFRQDLDELYDLGIESDVKYSGGRWE